MMSSKAKVKVCRICLRSDVGARDVDATMNDFYDELCEYDTYENQSLRYCVMCEHQLRKCFNFRQKCLRANSVLKAWRKKKLTIFPKNLHVLLPPSPLGFCSPSARHKTTEYMYLDHGPVPEDTEKFTAVPKFGRHFLTMEHSQNNDSHDDAQENIPLSNIQVTGIDIDFKDIAVDLKEENDASVSDVQSDAGVNADVDLDANDSDVDANESDADANADSDANANANAESDADRNVDSDVDANAESQDSYNDDSDLEDIMDRYIQFGKKPLEKKPNTRSISKNKPANKKIQKAKKVEAKEHKSLKVAKHKNNNKTKTKIGFDKIEGRTGGNIDDSIVGNIDGSSGGNTQATPDSDSPQANKKYISIKQRIIEMFDRGEITDLDEHSKITKEIFLKIYDKFLLSDMRMLSLKKDAEGNYHKLRKALLHLLKKYNPDYETVFDIEYLDTEERKLNEFNRRRDSKSYVDALYKCELCYRGFEKQTQFQYHNKWHTPAAGEFLCGICGMRFQSLKTRASHRASSHSAVYSCRMCPLVTYHYPVMLNHYEQHKGVEYSCPTCLSVFENKTTFMNHQRDHNADKKKSTCTSCAMTFISDVGLMLHRKSKHTDEVVTNPGAHSTCQECNITFDTGDVYRKHVAMAHTKKIESYRCAYCHIRFGSLEELRTHKVEQGHQRASKKYAQRSQRSNDPNPVKKIKINTPDKPFVKCELCPAMISTAYTSCMYKHFLKDHPDIPYSSVYSQTARRLLCDLCGKTFMDPAFFADHANMHSGAKPYLCTECPARFSTRRHLGLHAQRHGPARHVCNHCGKRFHSAANLFNHRKTHIGDRRFKCEICSKGFLHAATLNEHVRGVHHHIRKQKPPRDRKMSY